MSSAYATLKQRRLKQKPHSPKILSNQVLGVVVFTATELMFFTALVSAFLVIKAGAGNFLPPEGVRLPVMATAFNTLILSLSGALTVYVGHLYKETKQINRKMFGLAIAFGTFFVAFQGLEWIRLIQYGMTLTSDIFGATFYLLIGSHALHAVGGIAAMLYVFKRSFDSDFSISAYHAMTLFWLFIVAVWPVLYVLVYL